MDLTIISYFNVDDAKTFFKILNNKLVKEHERPNFLDDKEDIY
jgi:hypothetical protein